MIVYTAIIGNKDSVLAPTLKLPNIKYHLFTDNKSKIDIYLNMGWDVVELLPTLWSDDKKYSARRSAKIVKILPQLFLPKDTEYSLWMDGTHMPLVDPNILVNKFLNNKYHIASFDHLLRNCIYEEGKHILEKCSFLEHPELITKQLKYYKSQSFPEGWGLTTCTVMLRKHSPEILKLSLAWWEQICKFSSRDQLSLMYCHWKLNTKHLHNIMPGHWQHNDYVALQRGHINAKQ